MTAPAISGSKVRDLARRYIEAVLLGEASTEDIVASEAVDLGPEDRGLFQELTHGTVREWLFLDWVIGKYAPRPPRNAIRTTLNLSAYQILFLDRIPDYAIFSQAAAISSALGLSEPELKFVHGVLKTVQRNKEKLLQIRESSLARLKEGAPPEGALEWAILNAPQTLLDSLTVVDEKGKKKESRARAVRALAAMKERATLVGYALPGQTPTSERVELKSEVAPLASVFTASPELGKDLKGGVVRIQGEASQWSCRLAAQWLDRRRAQPGIKVLELASGKGGKFLGTLASLSATWGSNNQAVPPIEWWATDISGGQLRIFEQDAASIAQKLWPQVSVRTLCVDWRNARLPGDLPREFDLVWVDAPCTGFGTIQKYPQISLTRGAIAYHEALRMAGVQQALCAAAVELLRRDGSLLYSVCTMTRPETHGIVEFCVQKLGRQLVSAETLWPGSPPAPAAEGFFAAFM